MTHALADMLAAGAVREDPPGSKRLVLAAAPANPDVRLARAIANLRSDIADAIPFGLTYVSSDDLAVVMDAVEAAYAPLAADAERQDAA